MYFCVIEFEVGVYDSIFSGNEQQNVFFMVYFILVFVIVTSHDVLMDVMAEVNNLGLAGSKKPHRAFIGFQLDVTRSSPGYARKNEMFYNKNILDRNDELKRRRLTRNAARSLLIISCAEPKNGERYDRFKKELTNRAKSAEPFNTVRIILYFYE